MPLGMLDALKELRRSKSQILRKRLNNGFDVCHCAKSIFKRVEWVEYNHPEMSLINITIYGYTKG